MAGSRDQVKVGEDAQRRVDRMLDFMQFERDERELREMNGTTGGGRQNRILRRLSREHVAKYNIRRTN